MQLSGSVAASTIRHTLSDYVLASIDRLEISDPGIGSTREVFLNAAQFGGGISHTAQIHVDGWGDSMEEIYISMAGHASLDLSRITYSGTTSTLSIFVDGGSVGETIIGTKLHDTLNGFGGNDVIRGGVGYDTIIGGSGDDIIEGGRNADTLDGGIGSDTLSYANSALSVTVDLAAGTSSGGDSEGDEYVGFESVEGSAYNDELLGDAGNNTLSGGNGADVLYGFLGVDRLYGQGGDDLLWHDGDDADAVGEVFDGGSGSDTLILYGVGANLHDFRGDTLGAIETVIFSDPEAANARTAYFTSDHFAGGISETATISFDAFAGTSERIEIYMGAQSILNLSGLVLDDASASLSFDFVIFGSTLDETITGTSSNDTISGDGGNDNLFGDLGDDIITGGSGSDMVHGGVGADTMDGGAGEADWLSYAGSALGVIVDLDSGVGSLNEAEGDTFIGFEGIQGGAGDDHLYGNASANMLAGGTGNDHLYGRGGIDFLLGDAGEDTLHHFGFDPNSEADESGEVYDGGEGSDRLYLEGSGSIEHDLSNDTLSSIEHVHFINSNSTGVKTMHLSAAQIGTGISLSARFNLDGEAGTQEITRIAMGTQTQIDLSGISFADAQNAFTHTFIINGDNQSETILGSIGEDIIHGGGEADNLFGRSGADQLNGDAGDDVLEGGSGSDTLNGGSGVNTLSYVSSTGAVHVDLETGTTSGGHAAGDNIVLGTFSNLHGGAYSDTLRGDSQDNYLLGGAGGDALDGAEGSDWAVYNNSLVGLTVNLANSSLNTGDAAGDTYTSIENIHGTNYGDVLSGDDNANSLFGDHGADQLNGFGGDDTLTGGEGNDALIGGNGNDVLSGGDGDDEMWGGSGADQFIGGSGNDWVFYDTAATGLRVDLFYMETNTGEAAGDTYSSVERLVGSRHDDLLFGDAAGNYLTGGEGNDTLYGRDGNDALYGADGNDLLNGGGGNDSLEGWEGDDTLNGGAGADVLAGNNGHDTLIGGLGGDMLIGGSGVDTAKYTGATSGLRADLMNASTNTGEASGDTYLSVENFIGTTHDDRLLGNSYANVIEGSGGHDSLYGRGGNDSLIGGSGNDTLSGNNGQDRLNGGAGADRLIGGANIDSADYAGASIGLRADLLNAGTNTGVAAGDTYISIESLIGTNLDDQLLGSHGANRIWASTGDDTVYGRSGNDRLFGGAGDDTLIGNNGYDRLNGGAGADTLVGGGGIDSADYSGAQNGLRADLLSQNTNNGDAAGDTYTTIENLIGTVFADSLLGDSSANSLWGEGGNDALYGRGGNDMINGGAGNDLIKGGAGNDTLIGGAGADTFAFATGTGHDVITDFRVDVDTLEIGAGAHSFSDLEMTQSGGNVLVQFSNVSIVLRGVLLEDLSADDFTF